MTAREPARADARGARRLYLTPQHRAVLDRLAAGDTRAEIAAALNIGRPAVSNHLANARRNNRCRTSWQLLAAYVRQETV